MNEAELAKTNAEIAKLMAETAKLNKGVSLLDYVVISTMTLAIVAVVELFF